MAEFEPTPVLAAHTLSDAANTLKGNSLLQANNVLLRASEIYAVNGRFSSAAKCHQQIAETYDNGIEYKEAIKSYLKSAEYLDLENEESYSSTQAIQKAADLIILYDVERILDAIPVEFL